MNKVEQTLNSIDRANESVEDAKFSVQNTMFDVNSKIVTLEQQVESAYMENEYIQESVLAGTLIGGGILALIGGIVAAVKKFMGKSSSGDKSEETAKKASAGDQLAVVKMTGVSDDAIQKSIKELQDAINGLDLGSKEIPGTFVAAEGNKIQEDLNAIYAGLEELIELQNNINEAEDEAAQTKLIQSMTAKVKEISDNIAAIDSSKLKNQTAIPVPEAVASVQAAYAFKKNFSDQKKLDEIEKKINAAKSAKLKTDESGTSDTVKQSIEGLKKAMTKLHAELGNCLTTTIGAVDAIIAATRDAILAAAEEVKNQQTQQQQQQNTDEYPILAKYNITKEQVLEDMRDVGASQALTNTLPARLAGKKIEESDLNDLITAYSDIANKNNITNNPMLTIDDYKNDSLFMANVETGNPQPKQQPDQNQPDEYVTADQVIQGAYKVVTRNKTLTRDICITVINDLIKYDWVNPVTSIKSLISSGNIGKILFNCNEMLGILTSVQYFNLVNSDQTINSNYETICNGIINNFMEPIIGYLNSLGNDLTNANINKPAFENIKQNFEKYKEMLKQRGINPQQHDSEIDIPDIDSIATSLNTMTNAISHGKNVPESVIKKTVDSNVQKLSASDKKVLSADAVTKMDNVAGNLEAFVNAAITDTSSNEIKESTNNLVSGLVAVCQNVSNAIIDNNIKANMNSLTQRFQKITNDINSKQQKPQPQQQPKVSQQVIDNFKVRLKTLINSNMLDAKYVDELKDEANIDSLITKISELETDPSHFMENTKEPEFIAGVTKACAELWGPTGADKEQQITDLCAKYFNKDRNRYDIWVKLLTMAGTVDDCLNQLCKRSDIKTLVPDVDTMQIYIDIFTEISKIENIPTGSIKSAQEYFNSIYGTGSKKDLDTLKKDIASRIVTCAVADDFSDRPELKQNLINSAMVDELVNDICNDLGNDTSKIEELNNKTNADFINDIKTARDKKWPINAPNQLTETEVQALLAKYNLNTTTAPDLIKEAKVFVDAINSNDPAQINPLIDSIVNKINSWTTIDDINRDEQSITNYAQFISELIANIPDNIKSQLSSVPDVKVEIANKKAAIGGNSLTQDQKDAFVNNFMTNPGYDGERNLMKQKGLSDDDIKDKLKRDIAKSADEIEQGIKTAFFNTGDDIEVSYLMNIILPQVDSNKANEVANELTKITSIYIRNDYTEYFIKAYGNDKTKAYNFIQNELTKPETEFINDLNVMKSRDQVGYRILADIAQLRGMNISGLSDDDIIDQFINTKGLTRDKMNPYASQSDVEDSIKRGLKVLNAVKNSNTITYNSLRNLLQKVYEKADKDHTKSGEMVLQTMLKNRLFNGPIKKVVNAIGDGNVYTILRANDNIKANFSQYSNTPGPIIEQGMSDEELQEYINTRRHVFLNEQKEIVPNGSSEMFYEAFIYGDGYIEIL